MKTTTYIVHLVCTISLILPHGWCCLFIACAPVAAAAHNQTASRQPACHSCCKAVSVTKPVAKQAKQTAPQDRDAARFQEAPAAPLGSCECAERQSTPQRPVPEVKPEYLPPVFLTAQRECGSAPAAVAFGAADIIISEPPLQLLHCVWLC